MSDIKAAAAFLDREIPGWENLVEPEELVMSSCSSCVLGQIFGKKMEAKLNHILGKDAVPSFHLFDSYFRRGQEYLRDRAGAVRIAGTEGPFSAFQGKCKWVAEIADRRSRNEEGVKHEKAVE